MTLAERVQLFLSKLKQGSKPMPLEHTTESQSKDEKKKKAVEERLLREVFLYNELGGREEECYTLKLARTERSGLSFGLCQWDIANNAQARKFLEQWLVSMDMETVLAIRGNPRVSYSSPFEHLPHSTQKLIEWINLLLKGEGPRKQIDKMDMERLQGLINNVYTVFGPDMPTSAVVHLADMANQYGPFTKDGMTMAWWSRMRKTWSPRAFLEYKLQTKHGEAHPLDVNRRWTNVEKVLANVKKKKIVLWEK
jgi:hypothetical protein